MSYLGDPWNRLDLSAYLLIFVGIMSKTQIDYYTLDTELGYELTAIAAIPLSFTLFQYLSVSKRFGSLVIMIGAMVWDVLNFIVIFLVSVMGFGIVLWALFRQDPTQEYSSIGQTFMTLFSVMMGGVDYSPFPLLDDVATAWGTGLNGTSIAPWYSPALRELGITVYIVYVTLIGILLVNLLIACMAATHDRIDAYAKAEWAFLLVRTQAAKLFCISRSSMLSASLDVR